MRIKQRHLEVLRAVRDQRWHDINGTRVREKPERPPLTRLRRAIAIRQCLAGDLLDEKTEGDRVFVRLSYIGWEVLMKGYRRT